jgi:hypothetical protein
VYLEGTIGRHQGLILARVCKTGRKFLAAPGMYRGLGLCGGFQDAVITTESSEYRGGPRHFRHACREALRAHGVLAVPIVPGGNGGWAGGLQGCNLIAARLRREGLQEGALIGRGIRVGALIRRGVSSAAPNWSGVCESEGLSVAVLSWRGSEGRP